MFGTRSSRSLGLGLSLAVAVLLAAPVTAADAVNFDRTGLAVGGYDVVSYFQEEGPKKGDFQITSEHGGAVYRFATEKNRDAFAKQPERYLPQFGGYCAYGIAVGAKFSADPTVWKVKDNQLYLNLDENIAGKFNDDLDKHIANANENWKELEQKSAR